MDQSGARGGARETAAPITVAVDAMSGDNDPRAAVRGAMEVALEGAVHVLLVGDPTRLQSEFDAWRGVIADRSERAAELLRTHVEIVPAGSVIGMDEHPAQAVRSKRDASVVVATRLVADGRAQAAVSAGNSGATLAAALLTVGRIRGVARPAIGATFPSAAGSTFLLDVGANVDCKPPWLLQFGVMGDVYARLIMDVAEPRVGLLSIGEEAEKGSELVQEAHRLLATSNLRFVGNVEGRDIFGGSCDVVVTDGFTGNVVLKTAEGVAELLFSSISSAARASLTGKLGGALLKPRLRPLRDRVDYRKAGGALLLGVAGEVVIAHGRSDVEAMGNAVRAAAVAARQKVSGRIAGALAARSSESAEAGAPSQPLVQDRS
ncbi:MAG: phosphate acyltransferase PlsX [Candidatus Dormibacteria bacterium]|jgi:glycerol-3-phosphate acyltransferase PlsX